MNFPAVRRLSPWMGNVGPRNLEAIMTDAAQHVTGPAADGTGTAALPEVADRATW